MGETMTTFRPGLWVTLDKRTSFRSTRSSTYMLELASYEYLAGLRVGGLEVGAGVGLVPVGVDVSRGDWSVSFLSPRSLARFGFVIGDVRVSLDAFQQYTWRWWGEPDAWIRGWSVQLAFRQPSMTRRGKHPLVFTY